MVQHASNIVDFVAYRSRRSRRALPLEALPSAIMQGMPSFALPVLMPVMVGWLPVWMPGVVIAGQATDE